jgi:hypothetical protein
MPPILTAYTEAHDIVGHEDGSGRQDANVTTWQDNTVVSIDANYRITSTVRLEPCPQ